MAFFEHEVAQNLHKLFFVIREPLFDAVALDAVKSGCQLAER